MPTLYVLQISKDSVTPICHSLKVLKIHYGYIQVPIQMQVSSTAFLLRHFPQLEIVDVNFNQNFYGPDSMVYNNIFKHLCHFLSKEFVDIIIIIF